MLRGIYRGPPTTGRIHLPPHHGGVHNTTYTNKLLSSHPSFPPYSHPPLSTLPPLSPDLQAAIKFIDQWLKSADAAFGPLIFSIFTQILTDDSRKTGSPRASILSPLSPFITAPQLPSHQPSQTTLFESAPPCNPGHAPPKNSTLSSSTTSPTPQSTKVDSKQIRTGDWTTASRQPPSPLIPILLPVSPQPPSHHQSQTSATASDVLSPVSSLVNTPQLPSQQLLTRPSLITISPTPRSAKFYTTQILADPGTTESHQSPHTPVHIPSPASTLIATTQLPPHHRLQTTQLELDQSRNPGHAIPEQSSLTSLTSFPTTHSTKFTNSLSVALQSPQLQKPTHQQSQTAVNRDTSSLPRPLSPSLPPLPPLVPASSLLPSLEPPSTPSSTLPALLPNPTTVKPFLPQSQLAPQRQLQTIGAKGTRWNPIAHASPPNSPTIALTSASSSGPYQPGGLNLHNNPTGCFTPSIALDSSKKAALLPTHLPETSARTEFAPHKVFNRRQHLPAPLRNHLNNNFFKKSNFLKLPLSYPHPISPKTTVYPLHPPPSTLHPPPTTTATATLTRPHLKATRIPPNQPLSKSLRRQPPYSMP